MNQLEEYKFLRQELDANRKYVFERPLLIVAATFAAAVTLADKGGLDLLPIPFLGVLVFNMWFTANRLNSSARIVSYTQLVHEGIPKTSWIGWENSLRKYRGWVFKNPRKLRKLLKDDKGIKQFDGMGYYRAIYFFHLFIGMLITGMIMIRESAVKTIPSESSNITDSSSLLLNLAALLSFLITFVWFRPAKVRHTIELNRRIWERVFHCYPSRVTRNNKAVAVYTSS